MDFWWDFLDGSLTRFLVGFLDLFIDGILYYFSVFLGVLYLWISGWFAVLIS